MEKNRISTFLKQLRKTSGLSVNDVIKKLQDYSIDISPKTLYGYESGISMLNADVFVSLCHIYKCDNPMDLFGTLSLNASEHTIIEKYRNLDTPGQKRIIYDLEEETKRVEKIRSQQDQIDMLKQRIVTEIIRRFCLPFYAGLASAGSGEYLFDDIPTDMIEVEDTPTARKADFVIGVNGDSMEPDFYDGEKVFVKKTADLNVGDIGIFLKGNDCYIKELGADRLISRNKDYDDIWPDEEIKTVGKVIGKVEEDDV